MKRGDNSKYPVGTVRVKAKGLIPVIRTKTGWKKTSKFDIEPIQRTVHLYKSHANFNMLLDTKDQEFLKGHLTKDGNVGGARVKFLPDGRELNKAFSLFSPHLTIHDEETNDHWDVIYQNPNGEFAHVYTIEKEKIAKNKKYSEVEEFKERLPKLTERLKKAIENNEMMALPLYTLLKTQMRIGNEHSYNTSGHQGLTTLTKKNIKVKNNKAKFHYLGKDGVPQEIEELFPSVYLVSLKRHIKPLKKHNFIFTTEIGRPLKSSHFEEAFEKYSGRKFYPHIVRSYYATEKVKDFLEKNNNPTKDEVKELYNEIAERLGHKKFDKKVGEWKASHTVTVSHYIDPKLVDKINKIIMKK